MYSLTTDTGQLSVQDSVSLVSRQVMYTLTSVSCQLSAQVTTITNEQSFQVSITEVLS